MNQSPREGMYDVDVVLQMSEGEYVPLGKSTALLTLNGLELQMVPKYGEVDGVTRVCVDF